MYVNKTDETEDIKAHSGTNNKLSLSYEMPVRMIIILLLFSYHRFSSPLELLVKPTTQVSSLRF
jgi:phosphatidylserine decarboxylase